MPPLPVVNSFHRAKFAATLSIAAAVVGLFAAALAGTPGEAAPQTRDADSPRTTSADRAKLDRSPVDLVLTADEKFLVTANQTSSSLSLVDVATGQVIDEATCGAHPRAICLAPSGKRVFVSCAYSGTVEAFDIVDRRLRRALKIETGFHPYGIAISSDERTAYVALEASGMLAVIDLREQRVTRQIPVGNWPRQLALSHDGRRLAVSASGDLCVSVVDLESGKVAITQDTGGLNMGQLEITRDDSYVYLPWIVYRQFTVTPDNIRRGWVLATRIGRVRLDEEARREAISLDVPREAMGDPNGLALTPDESWIVCTCGGTHELLAYKRADQRFMAFGGPGDLADPAVYRDREKFMRIPLGGRPMNIRASRDNRRVFVANYLSNSVQVVDLQERSVVRTISLGGPQEPSLARQGEAIFHDARRSLDQWYSCASCHYEGGTNAVPMDTRNDGSERTYKTVLPLQNVTRTAPWTWHGWQKDIGASMHKSMTDSMLGPAPSAHDVSALIAYFETLAPAPNPYRATTDAAVLARGKGVFTSAKAGCANCHKGPYFTDGEVHDVGLGSKDDAYDGYNTPSLVGVYQRLRLLHDGRARSLAEVLTGAHNPAQVTGQGELSAEELADLIAYLKTL